MSSAIRFVTPAWTSVKDVFNGIAEIINDKDILGLQSYGSGRYEALLTDAKLSETILDKGVKINDRLIHVNIYKDPRKWIRVFGLPLFEKDDVVRDALSKYGKVAKITHETYEWNASLKTGVRRVLMTVASDLPDLVIISGTKCRLQGPGVKKVCFDCLKHGHLKDKCPGIFSSTPDPEKETDKQKEEFICSILSSIRADEESVMKKQELKNVSRKVKGTKNIDDSKTREKKIEKTEEKKEKLNERKEQLDAKKEEIDESKKRRNREETSASNDESVLAKLNDESAASFLDSIHPSRKNEPKEQPGRKPKKKWRESVDLWSYGGW